MGMELQLGVSFASTDFFDIIVTNATTLTATLTSDGKTKLESTPDFAADGIGDVNASRWCRYLSWIWC